MRINYFACAELVSFQQHNNNAVISTADHSCTKYMLEAITLDDGDK